MVRAAWRGRAVLLCVCVVLGGPQVAIHPTIAEEFVTFGGWGQTKGPDGSVIPTIAPYVNEPKL